MMKKKNLLAAASLAVVAVAFAAPASAQFAKGEDAVRYRQAALTVMAQHFGRLGAMASGKMDFDAGQARENADLVLRMSKLPWAAFGKGTEGGSARAEIWQEEEKFAGFANDLQAGAAKLAEAAQTEDLAQIKAAFGAVAGSCKQCHDSFKKD